LARQATARIPGRLAAHDINRRKIEMTQFILMINRFTLASGLAMTFLAHERRG
jgi:hypothetical protein